MSSPKLTKKQKKSLAFRNKTSSKDKTRIDEEVNDVPERDLILDEENTGGGGGEASNSTTTTLPEKPTKKRKRENPEVADVEQVEVVAESKDEPEKKKRKGKGKGKGETPVQTESGSPEKQRFLLFLGNLKYTTTVESIKSHFAQCDPPPNVRLLTPKATSSKPVFKSKGCAFLEFSHRNALQQGLKLHHSTLESRIINVELTAGGGGKGDTRLQKVAERNKELASQRSKQQKDDPKAKSTGPQKGERYSTTSGIEYTHVTPKTWTVGAVVEDDTQTHRGGQKHKKPSRSKLHGTGMNAIPLGSTK